MELLGGSAAVLVTALLAAFAVADRVPGLVGAAVAALVGMLAALLDLGTGGLYGCVRGLAG